MARQMLEQAFAAGVPAAWVTMDEAYYRRTAMSAELRTGERAEVSTVCASYAKRWA